MYRVLNLIYKKNSDNVMNSPTFTDWNHQTVAQLDGASWVSLAFGCNYLGAKIGRFDRQYNHATSSE